MKNSIRKNQIILIIDAIGWQLGQSFLSSQTIIPMFIARLSQSNFLIGLVAGTQSAGQLVPQLLAANWVERLSRKKYYVVILALLFERLPFLVMGLSILCTSDAGVLLTVFFACWFAANLGTGFNLPAFLGLFAKVMPENRRGRVSGIGNFAGTFLAVGGAFLARIILMNSRGLSGYAWVFLIGLVILVISVIPLGLIDEQRESPSEQKRTLGRYFGEIPGILKREQEFVNYILLQIALQLALSGTAFITAYAVLNLGATEGTVALFSAVLMGFTALGSLLFGILGDHRGYRIVFILGTAAAVVLYTVMAISPPLYIVFIVFALSGLFMGSFWVGGNMAMEYCPPHRAATYTAIAFTATAPFRIASPLLAGVLADAIGIPFVFGIIALASFLALYLVSFRVKDPRFLGGMRKSQYPAS
ncbi:MAG TPA: MFS transporter [Spirochaetia bacterium]|nr:MFS transporter [Spirochaetia bacterium]